MKCSVYLIGESLIGDAPMTRYIDRHLQRAGLDAVHVHKRRRGEQLFDGAPDARTVLIFCEPEQAALVAREIATYAGDTVTMRDDLLLPSKAVSVKTGYYTLTDADVQLHALTVYTGHDLPVLDLAESGGASTLHLFDVDRDPLVHALKQVSEAYRVKYALSEPVGGWTECRLETDRFGDLDGAAQQLVSQFLTAVAADNVALWLIGALEAAGKTVTFAESCTGGLISYFLTKESGASNVFEGALVTYSNRLKSAWIAVENDTLEAHGAVSREVVEEMSAGALEVAGADYAVAVSGIAGPTGGTPQKPVGTVHVAVRSKTRCETVRLQLHGDRNYIQEQTLLHAVKMLLLIDKKTFFQIHG